MTRRLISSGGAFEDIVNYSRAVVDGEWVWVSGTTGFDYAEGSVSEDVAEQTEQTFRNIAAALAKAGSSLAETVRVVVYIVGAENFERVYPVVGRHFKGIKPANTTVIVAALVDPRLKVEIEVTAKKLSH